MLLATEIHKLTNILNCAVDWIAKSNFTAIILGVHWNDSRHNWTVELLLDSEIRIKVAVENFNDGYRCRGIF
jgi:hypothetical protein